MSAKIVAIMGIICEAAEMALWIMSSIIIKLPDGSTAMEAKNAYTPAALCGFAIVLYILAFLAEQKQNNTFFLIFLIGMGLRLIGSGVSLGLNISGYFLLSEIVSAANQNPALKNHPEYGKFKVPIFFLMLIIAAGIFFLVRAVFYFLIFRAYRKSGDREQTQAEMTDGYADNQQMA